MPFFQTFSAESSQPGSSRVFSSSRTRATSHPASISAPSVMSPLTPEKQAKYARFIGSRPLGAGMFCSEKISSPGCRLILSAQLQAVKRARDEAAASRYAWKSSLPAKRPPILLLVLDHRLLLWYSSCCCRKRQLERVG